MTPVRWQYLNFVVGLTIACLCAAHLYVAATTHGLGYYGDTTRYFAGARSILQDGSYRDLVGKPHTWHPPGYSITLAAAAMVSRQDPQAVAKELHLLLTLGLVLLVGIVVFRATSSATVGAASALWVALNRGVIDANAHALAEAVSVFFVVATLGAFAEFWRSGRRWWLYAATAAGAFAVLCRYSNAMVVTSCAAALLLRAPWNRGKEHVRLSALFWLGSLLPVVLWNAYYTVVLDATAPRALVVHLLPLSEVMRGALDFGQWMLPSTVLSSTPGDLRSYIVSFVFYALLALVVAWSVRWLILCREREREEKGCQSVAGPVAGLAMGLHLLFLWFVGSFLDRVVGMGGRFLSVLVPLSAIAIPTLLLDPDQVLRGRAPLMPFSVATRMWDLLWALRSRELRPVAYCLFALVLGLTAWSSFEWVDRVKPEGLSWSSPAVYRLKTLKALSSLPEEAWICTRSPNLIYLLTGRKAYGLPMRIPTTTMRPNRNFDRDVGGYVEKMRAGGVFVYFRLKRLLPRRNILLGYDYTEQQWADRLGAKLVVDFGEEDGAIYAHPDHLVRYRKMLLPAEAGKSTQNN